MKEVRDIIVVKILNPEKYITVTNVSYGILKDSFEKTALVDIRGRVPHEYVTIAHKDYAVVPRKRWDVVDGQIFIKDFCERGLVKTALFVE